MGMRKGGRATMMPSNYQGDGSTLNLDFTTGVLDSRLTFSRASTATFVNSSGYVEYAGANIFKSSNDLSGTSWTKQSLITPSAPPSEIPAPSGSTTDITTVIPDTTNTQDHRIIQSLVLSSGLPYTISFYVKPNGYNFFYLFDNAAASPYALTFNLSTNQSISFSGGSNLVIGTPDAIGWRKISFTFVQQTASTSNTFIIRVHPNSNFTAFSGDGTSGILVWGFQINPGSTAQTYYPTTTAAYYAPRFDNALLTSRTNLVLQSNNFSTSPWAQKYGTAATLTSNYTAAGVPDGFSGTATRLQSSVAASGITQPLSLSAVSGKSLKFSLYIKSNTTANQVILLEDVTGGGTAWTATPVWQRFNFSTLISITKFGIEGLVAGLDISICGAQVEYVNTGDPATAYIPTTTSTVSVNTTEPRGLLIEGQTVNYLPFSNTLQGGNWFTGGNAAGGTVTVTNPYTATNPANDSTCTRLQFAVADGGGSPRLYYITSQTSPYTMSLWMKSNTSGNHTLSLYQNDTWVNFTVTPTWQRFQTTRTSGSALVGFFMLGNNSTSLTPDILVYGAQLELGSGASSYIPTGASGVTRTLDTCYMSDISSWFNQSEGTAISNLTYNGSATDNSGIELSVGTGSSATNRIGIRKGYVDYYSGGVNSAEMYPTVTSGNVRIGTAYSLNDFAMCSNGGTMRTDGSGAVPVGLNTLKLYADNGTSSLVLNGLIKSIKYFPTRLSNAQLQTLTTP
jgi:hypothetical protein